MQRATTDKLMKDLRVVVGDAEDLLKATASQTGEHVQEVRAKAEKSLRGANARLQELSASARDQARELNDQVHDHPWSAIGVAAGVGVVVGFLLARK
jgi:ElaB/YqjD/DUF883 family membrane-anchored ribosome-binding protein